MTEGNPVRSVVIDILTNRRPHTILDVPSGDGWLLRNLGYDAQIDGVDLFEGKPEGYRHYIKADLDRGMPDCPEKYEAVVSCEGIEHLRNPGIFLESIRNNLVDGGMIILSTPNVWYPGARLQYLLRGFFPSFPCLAGRIHRSTHMHIMPWSFPQLFLFLKLAGYTNIRMHDMPGKKPKHFYERILGFPHRAYCASRKKKAETDEEKNFWSDAGSEQSVYGRGLVVSAINSNNV